MRLNSFLGASGSPARAIQSGLLVAGLLVWTQNSPGTAAQPRRDLEAAKACYAQLVATELEQGILPGVSIAWIVDGQTVHAAGYGQADWLQGVPATADTIYRAGSISKLFNAVAAMQLVEQGKLDLDAPIQKTLPEFSIVVPFKSAPPLTVRQMLCHRSGMIREAPVGGYLDPNQPTVAATVASVASCVLVNPPNAKTRYSNVGPTIVGRAVEVQTGLSFEDYQQRHLLGPLGMSSSAWVMNDTLRPRLAKGRMRVARGEGRYEFEPALEFELGTIPAGNLYTSANDLARFAAWMMSGDASTDPSPALLKRASLAEMYKPQLIPTSTGFGLGFSINRYREHRTAQHMGAVYGFTTSLVVLPEAKIGVVVLSNCDIATAPVKRLSDTALDLLLEVVRDEKQPEPRPAYDIAPDGLREFAGEYESTSYWARLEVEQGKLRGTLSGQPITLAPTGPLEFVADGRILPAAPVKFARDGEGRITGFEAAGQQFTRVDPAACDQAPPAWQNYVGLYGPKFIPLVVLIRNGHLYATVENEYDYRLSPVNRTTFNLPPGMYADEQVVFQTDAAGQPLGVIMANMYLPRRTD